MTDGHTLHNDGEFILWDECPRCETLSKTLYDLTDQSLQGIAGLSMGNVRVMSLNESRATTHLKLMHRVILRSGIQELIQLEDSI